MDSRLDSVIPRPALSSALLRPATIWAGLALFFAGTLVLGATLAAESGGTDPFSGPILLLLGVSLIGAGFAMEPADRFLDPDVRFEGTRRYFAAGVSLLFGLLAVAALVVALV